jgi:hypothetical protein
MPKHYKRYIAICIFIFISTVSSFGGPPFFTDDPEPVKFKHWEYYISSMNSFQDNIWSGTSPHFECNYGLVQNVQIHLLLPVNYNYSSRQGIKLGYADTEFGIKYRFVNETDNTPQIGTFPIILIPTVKNDEFGSDKAKIFLPIWAQKSWGKLTTYGGIGYWINRGAGSKNWIFSGWEIQYDISQVVTLGGELYFHSADYEESKSGTGFNLGGFINTSEKLHIIFSFGHSLTNNQIFNSYIGLLWTI